MSRRGWITQGRNATGPAGTHIPFTTPFLFGACGRMQRHGLELLLPNPAGTRGTYVMNWHAAADCATPTLHDAVLADRLGALPALDPASVRELAREVAAEGYAGRDAAAAALHGTGRREAERLRLWSHLLLSLIRASDMGGAEQTAALAGLGEAGPGRMTVGLAAVAARLRWEPAMLGDALDALSRWFAPLAPGGRIPLLLAQLDRFAAELSPHGAPAGPARPRPASLGRTAHGIHRCLRHARVAAADAGRLLERPEALLSRWRGDAAVCLGPMRRLEQGLDGWDRILLLWRHGRSGAGRPAVLRDIVRLARLAADRLPDDEGDAHETAMPAATRTAAGAPRTRSAAPGREEPVRLVERNERIRALELDLENGHG